MITEADIAGIQCPYEGRAVALALWNERVREANKQTLQVICCAACGKPQPTCCCTDTD